MKKMKILILVLSLYILPGMILPANAQENYPVPVKTEKMLFYFQRSHNKNTVVYELNTLSNGAINTDKPVNAYWIRYEEGGVKKELSYIQVKAFGLKWKMIDRENKNFVLHFNKTKDKEIFLLNIGSCYKAYISINGELAELRKMYIKAVTNSLGFPLTINFIEISGIDPKTGKNVSEKYIP